MYKWINTIIILIINLKWVVLETTLNLVPKRKSNRNLSMIVKISNTFVTFYIVFVIHHHRIMVRRLWIIVSLGHPTARKLGIIPFFLAVPWKEFSLKKLRNFGAFRSGAECLDFQWFGAFYFGEFEFCTHFLICWFSEYSIRAGWRYAFENLIIYLYLYTYFLFIVWLSLSIYS